MAKKTKRRFKVTVTLEAVIEIDDAVFRAVDDDWRKNFYPLYEAEAIAAHVGFNLLANNLTLTRMDGFANLDDKMVRILHGTYEREGDAIEIDERWPAKIKKRLESKKRKK